MLGKLLKHELRSTSRIMGPLYVVLLVLSVFSNLSIRLFDASDSILLDILGGLIIAAFVIAVLAACIMSFVLMINRFRTNLMSSEGYLMFSLPVSVHQLVWSKIIASVIWFAATFLAVLLSGLIISFRAEYITDFFSLARELFRSLTAYYTINGAAFIIEGLVLIFLVSASICLLFYASMAVGHSFANRKTLMSVVFFFVFQFVTQIVGTLSAWGAGSLNLDWNIEPFAAVHAAMGVAIVCSLIYGAVFYTLTTYFLKKHLNLD